MTTLVRFAVQNGVTATVLFAAVPSSAMRRGVFEVAGHRVRASEGNDGGYLVGNPVFVRLDRATADLAARRWAYRVASPVRLSNGFDEYPDPFAGG